MLFVAPPMTSVGTLREEPAVKVWLLSWRVVPAAPLNCPLLVPLTPKSSVPVCRSTVPELLNGKKKVVVPVPVALRSVPAFEKRFVPPLWNNNFSACTLNVAPKRLLKVPLAKTKLFVTL